MSGTITKEEFEKDSNWGLLASVDLHECDFDTIRNSDKIKTFVYELCDRIGVKRFGDCIVVNFGEDPRVSGFSVVQLIETSLLSGHVANQSNSVYLDFFSCKYFDPRVAAEYAKEFFGAKDYALNCALRK